MMFIDPIVSMLHNTAQNTWHPILYIGSPLHMEGAPMRHKSKGHHTAGFPDKAAADEAAKQLAARVEGGARLLLDWVDQWDGKDIPASVAFFPPPAPVSGEKP